MSGTERELISFNKKGKDEMKKEMIRERGRGRERSRII